MFDTLGDVPLVWLGLTVTTTMFAAIAFQFPTSVPAPVEDIATTIESVAGSPHDSTATHPIDAAAVRIAPHRLAVRDAAGTAHAPIAYGPVTPVARGSLLHRVVRGTPPSSVFTSAEAFQAAVTAAQNRDPSWRSGIDRIIVRRVSWEGVNATLVTA